MMRPTDPIEKNDPLGRLLQHWDVDAALPTRFRDDVWRRIELTKAGLGLSWLRDLFRAVEAAFRRPALTISYLAILLLAGLSIGFAQARQQSARIHEALGSRYVQSVDPYQAPRH